MSVVTMDHGPNLFAFEIAERDARLDLFAAAPASTRAALRLSSHRIGTMGVLACPAIPITDLNCAIAVDADGAATDADLEEASAWLDAHATAWAFQTPPMARDTPVLAWLRERKLAPGGNGWAKFALTTFPDEPDAATGFDVREADAGNAELFGETVRSGFGLPETTIPWFAALVGRPGWRTYLAFDGTSAAAASTMYVGHDLAWLGIAATRPEFRRRGAHAALVARRIADARSAGLSGCTVETGYPAAGDETSFPSYRSYLRAGFTLNYVRPNYKRT